MVRTFITAHRSGLARSLAVASLVAVLDGTPARTAEAVSERTADDLIPLDLAGDRAFLQVAAEGLTPQTFLLDTGSSGCLISPALAERLHLSPTTSRPARGVGEGRAMIARAGSVAFRVGKTRFSATQVSVFDLTGVEAASGRRIAGVIGADLFKQFVVEIDPAARTLRLTPPDAFVYHGRGERLVLTTRGGLPYFDAELSLLDGQRPIAGQFLLDTGQSRALSLNKPFVDAHDMLRVVNAVPTYNAGMGGEYQALVGRLARFRMAGVDLMSTPVDFSQAATGGTASTRYAGRIGMPILNRFVLTIDYVNGRLYADPLTSASLPFEDDASGAVLFSQGWDLQTISVLRVLEGSAAATGGLRAGDTLVWIDDQPVFNLEATRRLFRKPGHQFHLMVLRGGEQLELTLTTRKR